MACFEQGYGRGQATDSGADHTTCSALVTSPNRPAREPKYLSQHSLLAGDSQISWPRRGQSARMASVMTAPQQPPWGYYPPPPPPAWVLPTDAYTSWATRLCAFLIDIVPAILAFVVGSIIGDVAGACVSVRPGAPQGGLLRLGRVRTRRHPCPADLRPGFCRLGRDTAYLVWNFGYRQGKTGSSIGKSVMKFKVVGEKTWQPLGFGMSLVRHQRATHTI